MNFRKLSKDQMREELSSALDSLNEVENQFSLNTEEGLKVRELTFKINNLIGTLDELIENK